MGNERNCTCIDLAFINGSVITINEKDEIAEAVGICLLYTSDAADE